MAEISDKSWSSFTQADYTDANDYCSASLIDLNEPGKPKTKGACKLPVREPKGGPLNRNGIFAAAARLAGAGGGVEAPPDAKRAAARKLVGYYAQLKQDPPPAIKQMAGM